MRKWKRGARGASLVEYACLLMAVTVVGGTTMRTVGKTVKRAADEAAAFLDVSEAP